MLNLSDFVHLLHAYASVMKFCAQIVQPETLNPLKNPPNPTAETLTLEKSPNPAQTLTLISKEEAMGLPERRGGRCRRHGNPDSVAGGGGFPTQVQVFGPGAWKRGGGA